MEAKNLPDDNQVSKAQKDVWEWKEKLYEQIKDLPKGEQLKFIISRAKETVEKIKAKRRLEEQKK